jgi:hypothetical protein
MILLLKFFFLSMVSLDLHLFQSFAYVNVGRQIVLNLADTIGNSLIRLYIHRYIFKTNFSTKCILI